MQNVIDISVSGKVGFMQRDQLKQQLQDNEAICRPTVSNTQFTIGRENGQIQEHIVKVFPINFPEPSEKSSLVSETWPKTKEIQPFFQAEVIYTFNYYPARNPGFTLYVLRHAIFKNFLLINL